jgi:hypothetical protein
MIDDLERVRRFRSEEPPPADRVREQARAALARAMAVSSVAAPASHQSREQARLPRRRRWLPRAVTLVAAAALCVLVVELAGSGSGPGPAPALAAALGRLAQIAASGPSLVPGPGQYLYVESRSEYPSDAFASNQTCITYAPDHRQVWIARDGSGLLQETTGATTFTSSRDQAVCNAMKPSPLTASGTSRLWFAAGCFALGPGNHMQALSTDPSTLLRQMRRLDGGPSTPGEDFVHVGDFLRETDASPAVRAALYRAAALIPGVRLLGPVRDHLKRLGLGVAFSSNGNRQELIFDPRTSALMAEETAGPAPGADSWGVYLQSRLVDRLPHRAPVALTPPCVNGGGSITHTPLGDVQTGGKPTS